MPASVGFGLLCLVTVCAVTLWRICSRSEALNAEADELLDNTGDDSEDEVDIAAQPLSCVGYGLGLSYDPTTEEPTAMAAAQEPKPKPSRSSKGLKDNSSHRKADKLLAAWEREAARGAKGRRKTKSSRRVYRDDDVGEEEYEAV